MKHSRKTHAINLLTGTLVVLIIFMVVTTTLYLWPRKLVEPRTTTTTQSAYMVGDEIRVTGTSELFVNGREDNILFLQCGAASYLIRTISLPSVASEGPRDYEFAIGNVPEGVKVSPPKCKVVTNTTYHIKFFLWFERSYNVSFESNDFDIIK